ncbi:MAG: DUF6077 domain-containing protein [Candidatus Choladocola sp.]|nr:DUF6077 domain-containing protein [Candidatus Choladocola sp.]
MAYQLLMIAAVIFLYLFLYYASGSVLLHFLPGSGFSVPQTVILGFFLYFFLFSVAALPLKILLKPLSWLSTVWAVMLAALVILFLILGRKQWKTKVSSCKKALTGKEKYITLAFLILILVQVIWFNLNDETYAIWDQSYYLGDTATSLYTNTISQYNPYTGRLLDYLNPEYLLETYQNHGAVMCQLLHLHPMVENLTIMASVVIILYQLIFFEIGKILFRGSRKKGTLLVFFLFLLNIFSYNLYTAAEFLIIRPSEGKTILAVLIIPALLFFFLKTAAEPYRKTWWCCSFVVILGSFGLNMSSLFMIPFEISAFYLPLAVKKKKLSIAGRYILLLLPCVFMAAVYLLTKDTFLIYTGK